MKSISRPDVQPVVGSLPRAVAERETLDSTRGAAFQAAELGFRTLELMESQLSQVGLVRGRTDHRLSWSVSPSPGPGAPTTETDRLSHLSLHWRSPVKSPSPVSSAQGKRLAPRLLCLLAALAGGLVAQPAPPQETRQQRGKRVVEEALAALGGPAFLHMEDRVETGRAYSFYNAQLSGLSVATVYTRYLAPQTGKLAMRERENFGKKQDQGFVLFNESGAWDVNYHGAKPLEDQRFKNYQESAVLNIFYILRQRLAEPGLSFYSQGSDRFENQPVEIVDITDGDGRTVTVYFIRPTKLPVRQSFRRRNPTYGDFDTETTGFAKYHSTGGIQWPFDIRRERNGDKIFEMYSETVTINQTLGDEMFTLPASVKLLPKDK